MAKLSMDPAALRRNAAGAALLMRSFGNEDRLLLLCELSQGERCVSDLQLATRIMQPSLSQQLAVLRAQALVKTRRDGKRIFYSIGDAAALELLKSLHRIFCKGKR